MSMKYIVAGACIIAIIVIGAIVSAGVLYLI